MRVFGLLSVALALLSTPAAGRDIYVNNVAGNDANVGSQPRNFGESSGPVRTIAKAIRLATSGDHIILADSGTPYHECVTLSGARVSGIAILPFVIDGNGAVLDGSAPIPPRKWTHYRDDIFRFQPEHRDAAVLFLDGHALTAVPVAHGHSEPPKMQPLEWCAIDNSIYFAVESSKLPEDYKLSYAELSTGITLFHVEHIAIKDLSVQGYQVDGIAALSTARSVSLGGVTCRNNGRSGISVGGASQIEIDSCTVANNGTAQILVQPYSEVHICNTDSSAGGSPALVDRGGTIWLGDKRIHGTLKTIKPEDAPRPAVSEKQPAVADTSDRAK